MLVCRRCMVHISTQVRIQASRMDVAEMGTGVAEMGMGVVEIGGGAKGMEGRVVQKRRQPALPAECLLVSKSSVRMRNLPLTRDQRAFGFDRRVIQLNYAIHWEREWPGPHLVSRVVHSVVHPLKEAVRTVFVGAKSLVRRPSRSRTDVEADTSEEKSHCVEEFPKRVGIGGLGGVGNPRQKVSIA